MGVKTSNFKVTRHKKHCRRGSWHSCECWLVLVIVVVVAMNTPGYVDDFRSVFGQVEGGDTGGVADVRW